MGKLQDRHTMQGEHRTGKYDPMYETPFDMDNYVNKGKLFKAEPDDLEGVDGPYMAQVMPSLGASLLGTLSGSGAMDSGVASGMAGVRPATPITPTVARTYQRPMRPMGAKRQFGGY